VNKYHSFIIRLVCDPTKGSLIAVVKGGKTVTETPYQVYGMQITNWKRIYDFFVVLSF